MKRTQKLLCMGLFSKKLNGRRRPRHGYKCELFAGLCSFFLLGIRPEALTLTSTGTAEISE